MTNETTHEECRRCGEQRELNHRYLCRECAIDEFLNVEPSPWF